MDKQAFMQELEYRLRHLTEEDKLDALEYYSEYIDDLNLPAGSDICVHLGTPKEVACQIIAQTTERRIDEQQEKKTTKGFGSIVWLAILGIFASPIAFPLALAAVIIFFSLIVTIASIVFAFGVSGFACVVSGIAAVAASFFATGFAQKLLVLGGGLVVLSLGIMFFLLTKLLAKLMVKIFSGLIRAMASRRVKKKQQRAANYNSNPSDPDTYYTEVK